MDARDPLTKLAELGVRIGRCTELDALIGTALDGLAELFDYEHSMLLVHDAPRRSLFTIASRGYERAGIGSEVRLGEGVIGVAAEQRTPMRIGNLQRMLAYARTVRRATEEHADGAPRTDIPLPGLASPQSQLAVPALVMGELVGVLVVESERAAAYGPDDEAVLTVAAALVAEAIEVGEPGELGATPARDTERPSEHGPSTHLRFYAVDGSTFLDDEYVVKGVAGRVLWKLAYEHAMQHRDEFTNRELRLDPALELPEYRDNLESRLILLKRRLEERQAPIRIERSGRGRFRVVVAAHLTLERVDPDH
ncbi:MAG TPA: GAF domain-containing protein [Acidimicrobiia bacterium]|nr:GAF domain-containing protein [Acidimicrobiia bacterium]